MAITVPRRSAGAWCAVHRWAAVHKYDAALLSRSPGSSRPPRAPLPPPKRRRRRHPRPTAGVAPGEQQVRRLAARRHRRRHAARGRWPDARRGGHPAHFPRPRARTGRRIRSAAGHRASPVTRAHGSLGPRAARCPVAVGGGGGRRAGPRRMDMAGPPPRRTGARHAGRHRCTNSDPGHPTGRRGGRDHGDRRGFRGGSGEPARPGHAAVGLARGRCDRGGRRAPPRNRPGLGQPGRGPLRRPADRRGDTGRRCPGRRRPEHGRGIRWTGRPQPGERRGPRCASRHRPRAGAADRRLPRGPRALPERRPARRRARHRPGRLRAAGRSGDRMTARQAGATTAAARWTWVDLRLAPVAATVWLTSLVAPWLAPALLFGVAGAAFCVAVAVGRRRRTATVVLAVLAAAVVTSGIAAVRGAAREASPLRAAAEAGRTALVQLELDSDPRLILAAGPPRVVADATVTLLSDDASTARMHAAVLLFAPADAWEGLLPGQQVSVRVRTSMPQPGSDRVAVVSARGPPTLVGKPGALQRAAGA